MEKWVGIDDFPGYSVSNMGRVRKDDIRILRMSFNQQGIPYVYLRYGGRQYNRAVIVLVANAFLEPHRLETFDTPINLDGDRANIRVENLMWRPRWFAYRYHRQFHQDGVHMSKPLVDLETGETYSDSLEASVKHGLLESDLVVSIMNSEPVWPLNHKFDLA